MARGGGPTEVQGLPENARRPLRPGGRCVPVVADAVVNAVVKGSTGSLEAKKAVHLLPPEVLEGAGGEALAMAGLAALGLFLVLFARRARAA